MHAPELESYLRRFIHFKSQTDPRTWSASEAIPSPLTKSDAARLAADIIAVAHFYDLPVDLFLGIGAMENNYMNVAGDLENTAWKRRAEDGDIVLKRRRGRVLVKNDSMGVWQITRASYAMPTGSIAKTNAITQSFQSAFVRRNNWSSMRSLPTF